MQKSSPILGNQEKTQLWGRPQLNPQGRLYLYTSLELGDIIDYSSNIVYHNDDLELSILANAWQSHSDSQINQGLLIPRLLI